MPINPEHEEFGPTDGDSRWFNRAPEVLETPALVVRQRWMCPLRSCSGEMVFNGSAWGAGADGKSRGWHHTCSVCGFTAALVDQKFPQFVLKDVPGGPV